MKVSFHFIIAFYLLLAVWSVQTQAEPNIDSMLHVAGSRPGTATGQLKLYQDIASYYVSLHQTVQGRRFADSLKLYAKVLENDSALALAHFIIGKIDRIEGNYDSTIIHITAYNHYHKRKGDSLKLAKGLFQLGVVHRALGNFEKSLPYYYRTMEILQSYGKGSQVAPILNSIGVLYKELKQYDQAITFYKRALVAFDSMGVQRSAFNCLNNLGLSYGRKGNYKMALSYYTRSLDLSITYGMKDLEANALLNLTGFYNRDGKYAKALGYALQAVNITRQLPEKASHAWCLHVLGFTYLNKGDLNNAVGYLEESLVLAKEIKRKELVKNNYLHLAAAEGGKDNFKKAYQYHQLYSAISDSLLNEKMAKQILVLKTKYEHAQQEKQIAQLTQEKEIEAIEVKRQKSWNRALMWGVVLISIIGVLIVVVLYQKLSNQKIVARKNEELKAADFQSKLSELKLKALRAQMNPHFIFNCLNSINRVVLEGEVDTASRYLTKFSKLIRMVLENSEFNTVPLNEELKMLEIYIQLEALRFKKKVKYEFLVAPNIDRELVNIPSMVLQPLVENAIWHGLMHKEGGGKILISIQKVSGILKCTVEDDGVGRQRTKAPNEKALKGKSFGLQIIYERLKLMDKKELQQLINIEDLTGKDNTNIGTRVNLLIPIA